ncbi:MAG: hypothetical protein ABW098_14545 [Candidatus Thiodiazotropha sp.]
MDFSEFVALVRATAYLHPEGDVDPQLIEALARLFSSGRASEAVAARYIKRPQRAAQQAMPTSKADVVRDVSDSDKSAPPMRQPQVSSTGSPRPKRQDSGDQLVAIDSVLTQIYEKADLEVEHRDAAPQGQTERGVDAEARTASPPVDDLFPVHRVRAVMREMSTLPMPSGRPDLRAAVKLIASGRPIYRMPESLATALPHSMLWLFESGPTMLPFSRDKQQLARTVVRLLGEDRIRIADFIADPLKGVRSRGQVRWQPLHWPSRDSAIVIVSDLGIGNSQSVDGLSQSVWMSFLEEADRRGVSTVLLNPYADKRWPSLCSRFDTALTWDTTTGVQSLRHTRRSGKGQH